MDIPCFELHLLEIIVNLVKTSIFKSWEFLVPRGHLESKRWQVYNQSFGFDDDCNVFEAQQAVLSLGQNVPNQSGNWKFKPLN